MSKRNGYTVRLRAGLLLSALLLSLLALPGCNGTDVSGTPTETPAVTTEPTRSPEGKTEVALSAAEGTGEKADVKVSVDTGMKPTKVAGEITRDAFVRAYLNYSVAAAKKPGQRAAVTASSSNGAYVESYLTDVARQIAVALAAQPDLIPVGGGTAFSAAETLLAENGAQIDLTAVLTAMAREEGSRISGSVDVAFLYNNYAGNMDDFYPVAYHLMQDGLLPQIVVSSKLTETGVPDTVSLLILVGEGSCEFSEKELKALAAWVREGGTLLCIGGVNGDGKNALTDAVLAATGTEGSVQSAVLKRDESPVPADNVSLESAKTLTVRRRFAGDQAVYTLTGAETFLSLGGQSMGVKMAVGQGNLLLLGLSESLLVNEPLTANFVREVVAYGLQCADSRYVRADALVVRRGGYCLVKTFGNAWVREGVYLNLLSGNTEVVTNPLLSADSLALYYVLGETQTAGGVLYSTADAVFDGHTLTVAGSARATETVILAPPEGKYPETVQVESGAKKTYYKAHWDKESKLLVLTLVSNAEGETVTLTWSDKETFSDKGFRVESFTVPTNNQNLDKDFLYFCNAGVNGSLRFADLDLVIIYEFPMDRYPYGTVSLNVLQNYIVEISPDAVNWTMIADYSQGGKVPHNKSANNGTTINVTPEMYGDWSDLFVRIRNSDVKQGWGGSITGFTVSYVVEN